MNMYICVGYYGLPEDPEGSCSPCFCNGNIDTSDPNACNNIGKQFCECYCVSTVDFIQCI